MLWNGRKTHASPLSQRRFQRQKIAPSDTFPFSISPSARDVLDYSCASLFPGRCYCASRRPCEQRALVSSASRVASVSCTPSVARDGLSEQASARPPARSGPPRPAPPHHRQLLRYRTVLVTLSRSETVRYSYEYETTSTSTSTSTSTTPPSTFPIYLM